MPLTGLALPPPLREGDRLEAAEFIRRWEAAPDLRRAELLDGVVFMPSPVSVSHSVGLKAMWRWILHYEESTPGCDSGSDCTWVMGPRDVPQPDIFLRILPERGGQSRVEGIYAAGAPELVVEVTGSTASRDLGVKLDLYRSAGVREYVTILLAGQRVQWRYLDDGRYRDIRVDGDGLLKSRVFPGLWLDPAAVWTPGSAIKDAVDRGLRSPEHAQFVRKLAAKSE